MLNKKSHKEKGADDDISCLLDYFMHITYSVKNLIFPIDFYRQILNEVRDNFVRFFSRDQINYLRDQVNQDNEIKRTYDDI